MRRRAYLRAAGVGAVCGLAGCSVPGQLVAGEETPAPRLVPGTRPGDWPFSFVSDGQLRGFEIALTEAVVSETPFRLGEWTQYEQRPLPRAAIYEEFDVAAATIRLRRRTDGITVVAPYYTLDQAYLVADGWDREPTAPRHLYRKSVGIRSGSASLREVRRLLADDVTAATKVRGYDDYPTAARHLADGAVDALIVDAPVGRVLASAFPVRIAFVAEREGAYGLLTRADDPRRKRLADRTESFVGSDRYRELLAEWFLRPAPFSRESNG